MILIVKSTLAFYIVAAFGTLGLLGGCGQPGALYLPKPPANAAPASPGMQPAPAPTATPPFSTAPIAQ